MFNLGWPLLASGAVGLCLVILGLWIAAGRGLPRRVGALPSRDRIVRGALIAYLGVVTAVLMLALIGNMSNPVLTGLAGVLIVVGFAAAPVALVARRKH